MIKVRKCHTFMTPESAENYDFSDQLVDEVEQVSFGELVHMFEREFTMPSDSPGCPRWAETGFSIVDYRDLKEENISLHFADSDYNHKYWELAWNVARSRDF
jgi:hypothetical protein